MAKIRRFDVFATFKMVECIHKGMDESLAKGEGLWLAKVVASRGRGSGKTKESSPLKTFEPGTSKLWKELSGIPQTDTLFDREIISRMGEDFYHGQFFPAVEQAYLDGMSYKDIRDSIRSNLAA